MYSFGGIKKISLQQPRAQRCVLQVSATNSTKTTVPPRKRKKPNPGKDHSSADGNTPTVDTVWRVFSVNVDAAIDAGKDDYSIQPAVIKSLAKKLNCRNVSALDPAVIQLVRKSFDARKNNKKWSYVLDIPENVLKKAGVKKLEPNPGQFEVITQQPTAFVDGSQVSTASVIKKAQPVIVVGSGPAGLFAALTLAESGVKVILLEQGRSVEERGKDIGRLMVRREGNESSNICFGEGGAGTYSDGKLTTRIGRNSEAVRFVLQQLVDFGGPEDILYSGKPHLGSDRLVRILRGFRKHLVELGAEIRFEAQVSDVLIQNNKVKGVKLADGTEILSEKVVLGVGHSARGIYESLHSHGVSMTAKPFAMGFRIEHPQALIDKIQYGEKDAETHVLRGRGPYPVADYRLATQIPSTGAAYEDKLAESRGVFSFCMCPGGQIVPTSSNPNELCINGMSFSKRNSQWANSALVVTVNEKDWDHLVTDHGPLAAMYFQRDIERQAAKLGGSDYTCPVQRAPDFLAGEQSRAPLPSSSYRLGIKAAPLHNLYSPDLTEAFKAALTKFNDQMPGYVGENALLHAAETRTSSAVRVSRDDTSLQSVNVEGLYPCGEGAGYAGGIVSAAVDGLRVGRVIAAEMLGTMLSGGETAMYNIATNY